MTASSGPRRPKSERPRSAGNLAPCVATRLRLPRRLRLPPRATRQYFRRSHLTLPRVRPPVQFLVPDVSCCLAYLTPTRIPLFDFRLLQSTTGGLTAGRTRRPPLPKIYAFGNSGGFG